MAVLTLGLGIGANAAIFAAVDRVMLRDLPYDPHDRRQVIARLFYPGLRRHDAPRRLTFPSSTCCVRADLPWRIADDLSVHGCVRTSSFAAIPVDGASERDAILTLKDGRWRYSPRSRQPANAFRMNTRDLARFGQLMLQGSPWDGRQVVPNDWIAEITRWHSRATRPDGESMEGVGYGMMWWVAPTELLTDPLWPSRMARQPSRMARRPGGDTF